jgi:hypothetical protein
MSATMVRMLRCWPEAAALILAALVWAFVRAQVPVWEEWRIALDGPLALGPRLLADGEAIYYAVPPSGSSMSLWEQELRFVERRSGRGLLNRPTRDLVNPANIHHGADGAAYFWKIDGNPLSFSFIRLDPKSQSETRVFGPAESVAMPFFTPDGGGLLILHGNGGEADWQGLATFIDLNTRQAHWTLPSTYFPRLSADGRLIWLGHEDRDWVYYTIHDRITGSLLARLPAEGDLPIRASRLLTSELVPLPDGRRIVFSRQWPEPLLEVWNVETGQCERTLTDFARPGDGRHLLSVNGELLAIQEGAQVRVHAIATGRQLYELPGKLADGRASRDELRSSTFLRNDEWLVLLDADPAAQSLNIYRAWSGMLRARLPMADGNFTMTSFYSVGPQRLVVEGEVKQSARPALMEWLERWGLAPKDLRELLLEYRIYDLNTGKLLLRFPKFIAKQDLTGALIAQGQLSPTGDVALLLEKRPGGMAIKQQPLGGSSRAGMLTSYNLTLQMHDRMCWLLALAILLGADIILRGGQYLGRRWLAARGA